MRHNVSKFLSLAFVFCMLAFVGIANAADYTKYQTADGLAYTGSAIVHTFIVYGTTAGDYATWYDAGSATGTPVLDIYVPANTTKEITIQNGVVFNTDIYVDIGTATTKAITVYSLQ